MFSLMMLRVVAQDEQNEVAVPVLEDSFVTPLERMTDESENTMHAGRANTITLVTDV